MLASAITRVKDVEGGFEFIAMFVLAKIKSPTSNVASPVGVSLKVITPGAVTT